MCGSRSREREDPRLKIALDLSPARLCQLGGHRLVVRVGEVDEGAHDMPSIGRREFAREELQCCLEGYAACPQHAVQVPEVTPRPSACDRGELHADEIVE